MRTRLAAGAAVGLIIGAALALIALPDLRARLLPALPTVSGKAQVGGPFRLTDQNGHSVSDADFRGRFMLVYFGYTFCPDICPAGLQVISAALDKLGDKADRIVPIFITLDPERDTPAKLADYVKSFHPRLVGLTGSASDIAAVAKAYRVYAKKVVDEKAPADYTLDHTSIIYLMDANGEFITHFTHLTNVDQLAAQLRTVL
jgi:protein SCO1/2